MRKRLAISVLLLAAMSMSVEMKSSPSLETPTEISYATKVNAPAVIDVVTFQYESIDVVNYSIAFEAPKVAEVTAKHEASYQVTELPATELQRFNRVRYSLAFNSTVLKNKIYIYNCAIRQCSLDAVVAARGSFLNVS